jgi:serine/threonine protein kinase
MSGELDGTHVPGYSLTEEIGRGGMGVVYAATQHGTGREVAIKVIRAGPTDRVRRQFLREARAAQTLRHPAIVPVHEHGAQDDVLYLVMDRVPGENLQELLDRDGALPVRQAVELVDRVAAAAGALHMAGVVHCDIKPANVLVGAADDAADGAGRRVLLTDFGVAEPPLDGRTVGGLTADPAWLRSAGSATSGQPAGTAGGTYAFMAPEQWRGEPVDARTDVYGLGALLHAALTGAPPHAAATLPELVYAVIMTDPPRPAAAGRAIPAALDQVVATAMARDPADRFGSAAEFAAALRAAQHGRMPARPRRRRLRAAARPRRWLPRRRRYQLLAAAVAVVLAGGVALAVRPGRHAAQERVVCAEDITLRPEPASSTRTATLHHGDRVEVTASARAGRWVLVTTADGRQGWAVTQFLGPSGCTR